MSLFTIKQILKDHWSSFSSIYAEKIRPVVSYEVNKVMVSPLICVLLAIA